MNPSSRLTGAKSGLIIRGRMHIRFSIHYQTQLGQNIRLVGSSPELGGWDPFRAPPMAFTPGGHWILQAEFPGKTPPAFAYKYCLLHPGGGVEWEIGDNREWPADAGKLARFSVYDVWRAPAAAEEALATAAFTRAIFGGPRPPAAPPDRPAGRTGVRCRFRVTAPRVAPQHVLGVLGDDPALGGWDETRTVPLAPAPFPEWVGEVRLQNARRAVAYKYVVFDPQARRVVHWEAGENRILWPEDGRAQRPAILRNDGGFRFEGAPWRGVGVAVPVFALRTAEGLGVGEFADIKPLVDWAVAAGIRLIQLLPVNDTVATHTWVDSYPYAAVSVFAMHPMYLRLEAMGALDPETTRQFVAQHRERLNALPEVDYEAVMAVKSRFFKMAYDAGRDAFLSDPEYQPFFETHREWLVPYAAFSCLRDRFGTSDYHQWPQCRDMSPEALAAFTDPAAPHFDDVAVHYYIQFQLHRQLREAADYARSRGVALKGDIPIGVYRHSVDTWMGRELFNLDSQAGAPPDAFAVDGQNWGFPTYNWEVMARDGFRWWRRRLTHLAQYFDAFRIDHILGFFRIWEIPRVHVQGIMGHFSPAYTVARDELNARGIGWDADRLSRPYIRPHMLETIFGEHAGWVAHTFLDSSSTGGYRLKPAFETQRQVEAWLAADSAAAPERTGRNAFVQWGLFRLIAEVVLLPDPRHPERPAYYPRHSMHATFSFRELDGHTQERLNALYHDYFYKRHEGYWRDQAMIRLPAIRRATNMLICGEDLGMVPDCVPGVMDELGILSLFIQRMPKDPRRAFSHPADCPYLSVCSPSTHDMSTVRGWWREDRGTIQRFYNEILGRWGEAPAECTPEIARDILVQHLYAPSMWTVFPLQDLLALDGDLRRARPEEERINEPSNPRHYWRYRMHLPLEALIRAEAFTGALRARIREAGRLVDS